jgi:hypothetical protein
MSETDTRDLGFLAKLVIVLAIGCVVAGIVWHGVTLKTIERLWTNLVERPSEPMAFRFILQPCMAALAAIKDGLADARTGKSVYLMTVLSKPEERVSRLREGLDATARIILLGIVMDAIYQFIVLKRFYPIEALIIALLLAFVPYLILRGPVARIARRWRSRPSTHGA